MKKTELIILNLIIVCAFVVAFLLWILSEIPQTSSMLEGFSFAWSVVIAAGMTSIVLIVEAFFVDSAIIFRRVYIVVGVIFLLAAIGSLVSALVLHGDKTIPTIAIIVMGSTILSILLSCCSRIVDIHGIHALKEKHNQQTKEKIHSQDVSILSNMENYKKANQSLVDDFTPLPIEKAKTVYCEQSTSNQQLASLLASYEYDEYGPVLEYKNRGMEVLDYKQKPLDKKTKRKLRKKRVRVSMLSKW